jgi:hypothetical protein
MSIITEFIELTISILKLKTEIILVIYAIYKLFL